MTESEAAAAGEPAAEAAPPELVKQKLELPDGRYLLLYSRADPDPGDA